MKDKGETIQELQVKQFYFLNKLLKFYNKDKHDLTS